MDPIADRPKKLFILDALTHGGIVGYITKLGTAFSSKAPLIAILPTPFYSDPRGFAGRVHDFQDADKRVLRRAMQLARRYRAAHCDVKRFRSVRSCCGGSYPLGLLHGELSSCLRTPAARSLPAGGVR